MRKVRTVAEVLSPLSYQYTGPQNSYSLFLKENQLFALPQFLFILDLIPYSIFLFPKLKKSSKRKSFDRIEERKERSLIELKAILSIEFKKCFGDWKKLKAYVYCIRRELLRKGKLELGSSNAEPA